MAGASIAKRNSPTSALAWYGIYPAGDLNTARIDSIVATAMNQENPIEEIWRIREKMGTEEGYDVHRLFERLRREQEKYANRLVPVLPRQRPQADLTDKRPSLK